eukprot:4814955-Amphidinium_carterae.1
MSKAASHEGNPAASVVMARRHRQLRLEQRPYARSDKSVLATNLERESTLRKRAAFMFFPDSTARLLWDFFV